MLKGVKAVLFDLDGTLVDSMWMWKDIDVEYLGRYGRALPPELQKEIEGMSFSETAVYFKERFGLNQSLEAIKAEWIEMAKEKYAHEVPMKPGALSFLQYLKEHGIHSGIATSNSRELLNAVMESLKLGQYIDCAMTSCEAGAGKPAPDIYLKVADRLGASPADCLVRWRIDWGLLRQTAWCSRIRPRESRQGSARGAASAPWRIGTWRIRRIRSYDWRTTISTISDRC